MLMRRDGPGDRQKALSLVSQALDAAQAMGMKALLERALALKLKAQGVDLTDTGASIDAVASLVYAEKPDLRRHAAPDGTVTILFSDIEGSTEKTHRLGDKAWMNVLREHNAVVRDQIKAHSGFEVKSEGDGFMLAFQSARKALDCAIAIQQGLAGRNRSVGAEQLSDDAPNTDEEGAVAQPLRASEPGETPRSAHPEETRSPPQRAEGRLVGRAADGRPGLAESIHVRMGLHAGEVIKEGEDFFGRNVIMAARVASQAHGGEILVSGVLKALLAGSDVPWGEPRSAALKGLPGQHEIWPVAWNP